MEVDLVSTEVTTGVQLAGLTQVCERPFGILEWLNSIDSLSAHDSAHACTIGAGGRMVSVPRDMGGTLKQVKSAYGPQVFDLLLMPVHADFRWWKDLSISDLSSCTSTLRGKVGVKPRRGSSARGTTSGAQCAPNHVQDCSMRSREFPPRVVQCELLCRALRLRFNE
nr:hypothetical protein CFP56_11952 [Quercus suber]